MKQCCNDYKQQKLILDSAVELSSEGSMTRERFIETHLIKFRFCPWCGKQLEQKEPNDTRPTKTE